MLDTGFSLMLGDIAFVPSVRRSLISFQNLVNLDTLIHLANYYFLLCLKLVLLVMNVNEHVSFSH